MSSQASPTPRTSFCSFYLHGGLFGLFVCVSGKPPPFVFVALFFWHMSSHMYLGFPRETSAPCFLLESLVENCIVLGVSGGFDADGILWKVELSSFRFYGLVIRRYIRKSVVVTCTCVGFLYLEWEMEDIITWSFRSVVSC